MDHLDIPTDWYELDWCKPAARGGSLQIIGRNMRWPVFVANSDRKGGLGEPFGYLRLGNKIFFKFNMNIDISTPFVCCYCCCVS